MANRTSNNNSSELRLEVTNVRTENGAVQIQVKGDRTDHEPAWWDVSKEACEEGDTLKLYRTVCDGLDKKRIVIAGLAPSGNKIECRSIRIQYADSATR